MIVIDETLYNYSVTGRFFRRYNANSILIMTEENGLMPVNN